MGTLFELLAKLDVNNQIRGRQFEHICKWYLENEPKYRLELKKVWLWDEWPGKWGPDSGIDLVAETFEKKLWAIQAKAYSPTHSITKADVDTFLSESAREIFSYRLLITTTGFIGKTAERTLQAQEKPVGTVFLSDLEKSSLSWPLSPENLVAEPIERKNPFPYQEKAISDVCKGFSENDRGQLIMACGTGKTLVALWVAEKLHSERILILLPSLSLLAQTLREWTANTPQVFHYLPVCSDDTVRGADHFTSRTSDLGLPVTTNPNEVAEFLRRRGPIIVFSTYQSSPVIAEAFTRHNVPCFDFAIADEAHRCAGIGKGPFVTILDSGAIKARKRLFMTATPRYFTDKVHQEADQAELDIASMDDEIKFGSVFHQLNFSEAIEQDLLCDYQVVIIGIDNTTYLGYAESGMFITTDGKYVADARILASHIALVKAIRKYDLRRVISFHSRIKNARKFSDELPDVIEWMPEDFRPTGAIWSKHVSGDMSSGKRDALLSRFRHLEDGERGLLSNARCLGEGVDFPTLDCVAFIDPRNSHLDIVQAVGRAIRKAPNKKIGTVVLPVFVDPDQDHEIALDSSAFKAVWNVLKALRAHDNVISESLDQLRRQMGQRNSTKIELPSKLFIDMPVTIEKTFVESLHVKIVEHVTASWEFFFGLLQQYIEDKGHALIPRSYIAKKGYKLGQWISYQQNSYKKGKLLLSRQARLEQLPEWVWDHSEALWQEGYKRLCEYAKREGHTNVPISHFTEDDYNLGPWVSSQRESYRKNKLTAGRQKALEQLPSWVWDHSEALWQEGYKRLCEYAKREGHTNVPRSHFTEDDYNLGAWVSSQRESYRKNKLTAGRQEALEQLQNWTWLHTRVTSYIKWPEGFFKLLCKYIKDKGHSHVPVNYVTKSGYSLGRWVLNLRKAYRQGRLTKEQQNALEKLAGWSWSTDINILLNKKNTSHNKKNVSVYHKQLWQEGYKHLVKFVEREGHAAVPIKYITKDGFNLGAWVQTQRQAFHQKRLSIERIETLEKLAGWVWSIREKNISLNTKSVSASYEKRWQEGYKHLVKFVEREGHTAVPSKHLTKDGYKLGQWVRQQRSKYSAGKLPKNRQKALESIRRWVWSVQKDAWTRSLKYLCKYLEQEGHPNVPRRYIAEDGYKLGLWVMEKRQRYKQGKLSKKQQKILEQLPGWMWNPPRGGKKKNAKSWLESLGYLREYVAREGHACVPSGYVTEDGYKLGTWVRDQRYLKKKGELFEDKQNILNELAGWVWLGKRSPADSTWDEAYELLKEFCENEGHACVPSGYVTEDGYKLGTWVRDQRYLKKKGELFEDKQNILNELAGWVWLGKRSPADSTWDEAYELLKEFCENEGHARLHQHYKTEGNYPLGAWVGTQRAIYKNGKLSKNKQHLLEKLPGWVWDALKRK